MEQSPFWFALYKLVKQAVSPYTWLCLTSLLLTLLVFQRPSPARIRWLRTLAVITVVIVWLLGSPLFAALALGLLESRTPPFDRSSSTRFDAVVVLGAGIAGKGSLRPADQLSGLSLQRTLCGIELFHEGRAPRLVLTGGPTVILGTGPKEAIEMRRVAIAAGVPEPAILVDDLARTTYENALGVKRLLGGGSILLVTSASHMPRAQSLFRKQGFTVTPAPCPYQVRHWPNILASLDLRDVFPHPLALHRTSEAIEEVVGLISYRLAGQL